MAINNQSIQSFINGFGGGTRPNRFYITGPIGGVITHTTLDLNQFHVRAASLPNSTVGAIPINYRGRTVVFPGDRVYTPWQITVLDDVPVKPKVRLYEAFHAWSNEINDHGDNTSTQSGLKNHFSKTDWVVTQVDNNGSSILRQFSLSNCWPISVGDFALDMGSDNTLSSFTVTIVYTHFEYLTITGAVTAKVGSVVGGQQTS